MAFREVTVIETKEVLRLWRGGVAKKRIAAQLGVDVKTVRGYLKVAEKLGLDPGLDLDEATAQSWSGWRRRIGVHAGVPGSCAGSTRTSSARRSKTGCG